MKNQKEDNEITPELFKEQMDRLEGAFPNLRMIEMGRGIWYKEILNKNFQGSDLVSAISELIEVAIKDPSKARFIDLPLLLKMLYGVRNAVHKEENRLNKIKEEKARKLSMDGILAGGRGKISETNKEHIDATRDFIAGKISRKQWMEIKANIKKKEERAC